MTEYTPLKIPENYRWGDRLRITILDNADEEFAFVPLHFYASNLHVDELINHPANVEDFAKAQLILTACNTHEDLVKAVEDVRDWIGTNPKQLSRKEIVAILDNAITSVKGSEAS